MLKRLSIALFITILLQIADYFITNASYPVLDSVDSMMIYDFFNKKGDNPADSDVLFVNVGFDKSLAPVTDEFFDTIGTIPITDRKLLTQYLNLIKDVDYKYIFLDIRFENGIETPYDSVLFPLINSMERIAVSTHRDENRASIDELNAKSGYADYRGNFMDGFTRYEYIQDGKESVALKMAKEIDGIDMKKLGPLYLMDGKPAYNMQFIPFYRNDASKYGENGYVKYPYLGGTLFKYFSLEELKDTVAGKIVVLGDFENDVHQTYMGNVAGPILSLRAYQNFVAGKNRLNWICFGITTVVYFLIIFGLLGDYNLNDKICKLLHIDSKSLAYILTFIGWGFILSAVKITLYAIYGIAFIVFLPALVFSTLSYIKDFREFKNTK